MKVLVNGCSHSKLGYSTFIHVEGERILIEPPKKYNPSWQRYLAKKLNLKKFLGINTNYKPAPTKQNDFREFVPLEWVFEWDENNSIISLATDGKGNDSIMMDTLSTLREFENKGEKIDLVLIQFSGPTRRLVSPHNIRYAYANPHDNFEYGLNFEPSGSLLTLHNMVILQDYLKKGGYEYYFLNYFGLDESVKDEEIYKELDLSHFITYKDNHPIFDGWLDRIKKDNLAIDDDGHPSLELMQIISDKFCDKILKNKAFI